MPQMKRGRRIARLAALGAWLIAAGALGPAGLPPPPAPPAGPVRLDAAVEAAAGLPRLHGLLVSWRGNLVVEKYFHGARANRPANIKSASKTVISSLVGIAIEQGKIESLDTPIASFFPKLLGDGPDPPKRAITVEDLVSMRAGLESTSGRNYGRWVRSGDWVRHILSRPMAAESGGPMIYSTGTTHLLSAILTKATGASTRGFAQEFLAGPLGFDLAHWPRDPQGIYFGGNDMLLTPRQMLAFGELYLHRGRANGKQIIPESWVDASWVPRTRSRRSGRMYGYGWWMRELGGVWAYYAWGYGGQFIFVVPKLDTVIVTTASDSPGEGRRGHLGGVYDLVGRLILEPIAGGGEVLPLEQRAD